MFQFLTVFVVVVVVVVVFVLFFFVLLCVFYNSGPHRMRKKMYRNDKFYVHYPYDSKVARQVREVSHCIECKLKSEGVHSLSEASQRFIKARKKCRPVVWDK